MDGWRFGSLVVLGITDQRSSYGSLLYRCRCDCGREKLVVGNELRRGHVTSCGAGIHHMKDITGQRFGRLVALHPTRVPDDTRSSYNWMCRCDCGTEVEVNVKDLVSGGTVSCGCALRDNLKKLFYEGTSPCKLSESDHPRASNTSGVTGVWYDKRRDRWTAEIMLRRKKIRLGRYKNKEDAIKARRVAEDEYFQPLLEKYAESSRAEPDADDMPSDGETVIYPVRKPPKGSAPHE